MAESIEQGVTPGAEKAAAEERAIQDQVDSETRSFKPKDGEEPAMQAGARPYPTPPFPKQHLEKPGIEADLDPAPLYDAPFWKGSGKLEGKIAFITGGDSGIGRAVAVLFARDGADIAIAYLTEGEDAEATKAAVEKEGRTCLTLSGDVADAGFCRRAVAKVAEEFGRIDVLVNNAAFQEHVDNFDQLTDEHFDRTLKTNLYGYFYMAKAVVPHMAPGSSIINTASVNADTPSPQLLAYATTKGAIQNFTGGLAQLLAEKQIRANAVAPGPVWTPLIPSTMPAEKVENFGSQVPFGRPAQPAELAGAYVLLASDDASYISGATIAVTGGKPII